MPIAKIIYTRGAPGSGKTTIAERYAARVPNTQILSLDDFRTAVVRGRTWDRTYESLANAARFAAADEARRKGWTVILDQTCAEPWAEEAILDYVFWMHVGPAMRWDFITPIEICIGRNNRREAAVPTEFVTKAYNQIQERRRLERYEPDPYAENNAEVAYIGERPHVVRTRMVDTNQPRSIDYFPDYLLEA